MNAKYTQRLNKIEAVLFEKIPKNLNSLWRKHTFWELSSHISDEHIAPLVNPARDLLKLGGKRWRPLLLVLVSELIAENHTNHSTQKKESFAYELTPIVEFIHTASLIHDDIEDGADMRRGKPAAHITYGIDTAINAASWLYFLPFSFIELLNVDVVVKNRLYAMVSAEIRRLHLGQSMDIAWHRNPSFLPSKSEYEAMVRLKTGTLACLAAKLGAVSSFASERDIETLGTLAVDIGFGFQVLDDVLNLTCGNVGKKRGDDIVEGKKSLPIILHLEKYPQDASKITDYFMQAKRDGINSEAVEHCIVLLQSSNAIFEAKKLAHNLISDACSSICNKYPAGNAAHAISDLFLSLL